MGGIIMRRNNELEKKDIDITKTPWYNIVKFGLGALLAEDTELRAAF